VGRIQDEKGQFLVIDAIKRLKNLNIKALIVGDTMDKYYLNNLKQQIKNQNIENKIIFVGFTKDINEYMSIFDVNILATTKETFGLVVIEAMINKVCIIATNSGGPLEIIDDGVDGLLFERDSKNLAKKIKLLYDDKNYKDNLALAGYRKAKDMFDSHTQNTKLYNLIENII
jgi:glycosyltransferase involved in cell wall biosynthesis